MMSDWHMPEICWFHQICLFWKSHRNPVLKMLLISIGSLKTNMALLHARQDNKADKSASNSLNPSIFEGLVTLCAPDAVCFSRHIPHASGRILAERFYVIGTLRSNFLLHKKFEKTTVYIIVFSISYLFPNNVPVLSHNI